MQDDYKSIEKLHVRKSLFTYSGQSSFAKRFVPEFVACEPGMMILDVGCGTGEDIATIGETVQGCTCFGIDSSKEMITTARAKNPQGIFAIANMETCTLQERFDRIIIRHALHLATDKALAIKNIVTHLAPKGKAIFALHSTQSLPKMGNIIREFCIANKITFSQGQDVLAGETSDDLFAPYACKKITTIDTITLTEPTPYTNYIESRRTSFSPPLSDELFSELLQKIREAIEKEIAELGMFTEISTNSIITVEQIS